MGIARRIWLPVCVVVLGMLSGAPPAIAALEKAKCSKEQEKLFTCATLDVPLDWSGATPGTIELWVMLEKGAAGRPGTLLMLSGGPGQAASSHADLSMSTLAPLLESRRFVTFDQRGTGRSGAIDCPALQSLPPSASDRGLFGTASACGESLGDRRNFFTTADSVKDIEALRAALDKQTVGVSGVSYGTYVATRYAAAHPERTDALVLDSVMPLGGVSAFALPDLAAARRALPELCAGGRCRGIATDPLRDVARLTSMADAGEVKDFTSSDIWNILWAGDLNYGIRAGFISAARSALSGFTAPLRRLRELAYEVGAYSAGSPSMRGGDADIFSMGLLFATNCGETAFPWAQASAADVTGRQALVAQQATQLDPAVLYPFSRQTVARTVDIMGCLAWPPTTTAPQPAPTALPDVPALLMSGTQDLRTPVEDAQAVAALMPKAHLVTLPGSPHDPLQVGYSLLGGEKSCTNRALQLFARGTLAGDPCGATRLDIRPTAIAPRKLANLNPVAGVRGNAGRIAAAAVRTTQDAYWVSSVMFAGLAFGSEVKGLKGGTLRVGESSGGELPPITLSRYSYVPGVKLSGTFTRTTPKGVPNIPAKRVGRGMAVGTFEVSGPGGVAGTLDFRRDGRVEGTLGGRRIRFRAAG